MTTPRRKPSDDDKFWDGIAVTRLNRRFLFDVLALAMLEMQHNDGTSPPMSFSRYREAVYEHVDALARETNRRCRYTKIDNELLKARMDIFLGLRHAAPTRSFDL